MTTENSRAFQSHLTSCTEWILIDPMYLDGQPSVEPVRNATNMLKYVLNADVRAWEFMTAPDSINVPDLWNAVEWADRNLLTSVGIRQRVHDIRTFLMKYYPAEMPYGRIR